MRISDGRSDVCSSDLLLVPGFVAVAFANKIIPALLLVPIHGRRKAVAAGVLLSARLSLIVAASDIATRIGVLDTATNAAMVLVAIISAAMAPLLFNVLAGQKKSPLVNAERSEEHTSELQPLMRISYAVFC